MSDVTGKAAPVIVDARDVEIARLRAALQPFADCMTPAVMAGLSNRMRNPSHPDFVIARQVYDETGLSHPPLPAVGSNSDTHPMSYYQVRVGNQYVDITSLDRDMLVEHLAFAIDSIQEFDETLGTMSKALQGHVDTWRDKSPQMAGLQGEQSMREYRRQIAGGAATPATAGADVEPDEDRAPTGHRI